MSDLQTSLEGTPPRRQSRILERVRANGHMRVEQLASEVGVSTGTIYRDVTKLEQMGLLKRVRGEISAVTSSLSEMTPLMRAEENSEVKTALARCAEKLIPIGSSVFADDSSTVLPLTDLLLARGPITLLTNSVLVSQQGRQQPEATLYWLGGKYVRWADACHGPDTVRMIRSYQADFCVMSDAAVNGRFICNPYSDVVLTKQAMMKASKTRIFLADHTKFTRRALHVMAPLDDFDFIVVDSATPTDTIRYIQDLGPQVLVAPDSV